MILGWICIFWIRLWILCKSSILADLYVGKETHCFLVASQGWEEKPLITARQYVNLGHLLGLLWGPSQLGGKGTLCYYTSHGCDWHSGGQTFWLSTLSSLCYLSHREETHMKPGWRRKPRYPCQPLPWKKGCSFSCSVWPDNSSYCLKVLFFARLCFSYPLAKESRYLLTRCLLSLAILGCQIL